LLKNGQIDRPKKFWNSKRTSYKSKETNQLLWSYEHWCRFTTELCREAETGNKVYNLSKNYLEILQEIFIW
jgi:hypothetical protein